MIGKRPSGVFMTGTNTAVGKTFVAAALARSLVAGGQRVGVYKPVLSGCRRASIVISEPWTYVDDISDDDDVRLWLAAGASGDLRIVSPQKFHAPLAPHLAARREGRTVDAQLLRSGLRPWQESADFVIVEGAGGLFSPIADDELNADLAYDFGLPIVVVAGNGLGVIHSVLATLFAARAFRGGLNIAAVVLNDLPGSSDESCSGNLAELERRCAPCPVVKHSLGEVKFEQLARLLRSTEY